MSLNAVGLLYCELAEGGNGTGGGRSAKVRIESELPHIECRTVRTRETAVERACAEPFDFVVARCDSDTERAVSCLSAVRENQSAARTVLLWKADNALEKRPDGGEAVDDWIRITDDSEAVTLLVSYLCDQISSSRADPNADRGDETAQEGWLALHHDTFSSQLKSLARTTPDAMLTIDDDSTIHFANPAIEDILGYAPEEVLGKSLTILMARDVADRYLEAIKRYQITDKEGNNWKDAELTARHRDGHEVPVSISFSEFYHDEKRFFTGVVRDITERKRRTRDLELSNRMLEAVRDGVYAIDGDDRYVGVNQAYADLLGIDRNTLLEGPAEERHSEAVNVNPDVAISHTDGGAQTKEAVIERPTGSKVPIEIQETQFPLSGEHLGRAGVVRDITGRKRREEQLKGLNEFARRLLTVETEQEVCEIAAETAERTLEFRVASIERYDNESGRLHPVARTPGALHLSDDNELFESQMAITQSVYANQQLRVIDDIGAEIGCDTEETVLKSALFLPIGGCGVLVLGAKATEGFTEQDITLGEMLAADVRAAIDRVEREQRVRDKTRTLEAQKETLERVNRINTQIRQITQSLLTASSRKEIGQAVCAELVSAEPYVFAWLGQLRTVDGGLVPQAFAGLEQRYLDEVTITTDDAESGGEPAGRAARGLEPQVQNNLHDNPPFEPWRGEAIRRGYRSVLAVPLIYNETLYGVLSLYADRANVFDEMEVEVIVELGELIGYSFNSLERRRALVSGNSVELKLRIVDTRMPLFRFAKETGARVEYEGLVEQSNDSLRTFYTVSNVTTDQVEAYAHTISPIEKLNLLSEREGEFQYEAVLEKPNLFVELLEAGAYPTEFVVIPEGIELTVELPVSGDIKAFLQMIQDRYNGVDLLSRKELNRPMKTNGELKERYKERLTERQEEVLKTAFYTGYFDIPRESSASDIANLLEVSQPTVSRHLRSGEREILEMVFGDDEEPNSDDTEGDHKAYR